MVHDYLLPSSRDLHGYLEAKEWTTESQGPVGTMWRMGPVRIAVPTEPDEAMIRGVIARLARAEGRSPKEVADAVRYLRFDVTYLRAVHDQQIVDKIPLDTASKIITAARMMLRATATTARAERVQIGNSYSRLGDRVIHRAFMGHTEQGSFVIPVLVPISDPPEPDDQQPMLMENSDLGVEFRAPMEPFERRVVRTFAQSMQAVRDLVVTPGVEPTKDTIHQLVYCGVSREFVSALAGILSESAVAEFETRVEWAPMVVAPAVAEQVGINAHAVDLVKMTADKMRQQRSVPPQVYSGTIVQLRHEQLDDPFGEIGISTVRRGRVCEIRVRLPLVKYTEAWNWHHAGRAVLVEGEVRRTPGKPSLIENPSRCHPLDELFLR